jgi:hypothetical protein
MVIFPKKNQVIFQGQFGFRLNHSAILSIVGNNSKSSENKMYSCGTFLD